MTERKNWKCAISVPPRTMNENSLTSLCENGITEVELSSGALKPFYTELDFLNKSKETVALAKSCGVNISSVHLPFSPFSEIDPASLDKEQRKKIVEIQSALLSAAGEAGIKIAVIHPSGEPYREEERSERIKAAIETISAVTDSAEKYGVTLALENLPRTCLCRTHDEMLKFLEAIPSLRVCFDMNHNLSEANEDYIEAVADRIVTVHVSDYDRVDERHWLPMKGVNNWESIISLLEKHNYNGRWLYELREGEGSYADVYENYRRLILK